MYFHRPIAKSGSALLASQLGLALFGIVFTAYIFRILTKEEVAVIALLEILTAIFSFSELGLITVAVQQAPSRLYTGEDKDHALALVKCALQVETIVLFFLGAIAWVFSTQVSQLFLKTPEYSWAVKILIPGAMVTVLFYSLQGIAQTRHDFYSIARWNLVAGLLRPTASILAFWVAGFPGFVVFTVISLFIPLIGIGWSLRDLIFNNVPAAPYWATLRYGLPFYLRSFLRFGYTQFDQALVGALLTPEVLASYNVARRFRKHIQMFTDSFQVPIMTRMAAMRQEPEQVQVSFFVKATRYTTLMVLPVAVMVAAVSPWLMSIYGGDKYASYWPLLAILSLAQGAYALYSVYASAIFARLKPWATLLVDGVNGGINYLLAPILIIGLAQYGVAWSQLAGYIGGILAANLLLKQLTGFRFDRESLRTVALPLFIACGVVILGQVVYFTWWSVPLYIVIAVGTFVFLVVTYLSDDDWEQIRNLIPTPLLPIWTWLHKKFQRNWRLNEP